jgi:hypothetical protein
VPGYGPTHSQPALGAELNGLANGAAAVGTTVIDNTANRDVWGAYTLTVVFAAAPTAGTTLDLYEQPAYDGSTFDTLDSGNLPQGSLQVASFEVKGTGLTQNLTADRLTLTPKVWHAILKNTSGVALAASGHAMTLDSWQTSST